MTRTHGKAALFGLLVALLSPAPGLAGGPPPVFSSQPASQAALLGDNVYMEVVATSGTTISYQWLKNGTNIADATQSSYSITNVQLSQQGAYTVKVTNAGGTVTSSNAILTVLAPPTITTQAASQLVVRGQNAAFSVTATGTAPLSYQWSCNGAPLSGATNATLIFNPVRSTDAGTYTVLVTNAVGSASSTAAQLTVTNPPSSLSVAGSSAVSPTGFTFQLSVPAGSTYIILASTNTTKWTPIATNVAQTGSVSFTDAASSMYRQRFYRALVP